MWTAAVTFSLIHQFLVEYGGLNSHNVPQPAPNRPRGSTDHGDHSFIGILGLLSQPTTARSRTKVQHPTFLHRNQAPEQGKLLPSRYVRSKLQQDHARDSVTPSRVGAISQHICGKGVHSLPDWSCRPHRGRRMLGLSPHATAPLQSADGNWCSPCFPLQGVGCRRQTYLAVEGICLERVTAGLPLDTLASFYWHLIYWVVMN